MRVKNSAGIPKACPKNKREKTATDQPVVRWMKLSTEGTEP